MNVDSFSGKEVHYSAANVASVTDGMSRIGFEDTDGGASDPLKFL